MSDDPAHIHLPTENWMDVFAFVPRRRLATNVALANRMFSEISDCWLHEKCGQVALRNMHVLNDGILNCWQEHVPFPSTGPVPTNIVDFQELNIYNSQEDLDLIQPVLEICRWMTPLFSDVNIWLYSQTNDFNKEKQVDIMQSKALYLLDGLAKCLAILPVNSIRGVPDTDLIAFSARYPNILANLRVLYLEGEAVGDDETMDLLCHWLSCTEYAARKGAKPRMLRITLHDVNAAEIIWRLRQAFFQATSPAAFFVRIQISSQVLQPLPEFVVANKNTDELYSLQEPHYFTSASYVLARYPKDAEEKWLEQMTEEVLFWQFDKQSRRILLHVDKPIMIDL